MKLVLFCFILQVLTKVTVEMPIPWRHQHDRVDSTRTEACELSINVSASCPASFSGRSAELMRCEGVDDSILRERSAEVERCAALLRS